MSEPIQADEEFVKRAATDLDRIVTEEILRARIRKLVDERPPEPWWERLAKNPLVTLIVGFGLTWGVGTLLTDRWERVRIENQKALERVQMENQRKLVEERRLTEARVVVINEFFSILREHIGQALLVEKALARDAPASELADLVRTERELFSKFNTKIGAIQFNLRTLLTPELYQRIVVAIDRGVYIPLMAVDEAHAKSFEDRLLRRQRPKLTPDEKESAYKEANRALFCSYALADAIWYNAIARSGTEEDLNTVKKQALKNLDNACEMPL